MKLDASYFEVFCEFGSFSYKSLAARTVDIAASFGTAFYLSRIDANNLLASGLISSLQNFILRTGRLALFGTPTLLKESKNPQEEAEYLQHSRNLSLLISIPMIVIYCISEYILVALGQNKEYASIAQNYLYGYAWGVPAVLFQMSNQQFLYFRKQPWAVFGLNTIQTGLILGLGALMTFGLGLVPTLGASGLGHATSIVSWIMCLATTPLLTYIYGSQYKFKFINPLKLTKLAYLGFPIAVQMGAELFSLSASVQMSGWLGANTLAATEAVLQWTNYVAIPMQTLSQSTNILISQELKAKNEKNAQKIGNISPFLIILFPLIGLIISAIFGKSLVSVFINSSNYSNDQQKNSITSLAYALLLISIGTLAVDSIRTGYAGGLRGYGHTVLPGLIGLINLGALALLLSYLAGITFNAGAIGIFGTRIVPTLIGSAILMLLWFHASKNYDIENHQSKSRFLSACTSESLLASWCCQWKKSSEPKISDTEATPLLPTLNQE